MKKHYSLCVIGGDGIGPEVVGETIRLLEAIRFPMDITQAYAGYACYKRSGIPLPEETIRACKKSDAILFGAVTTPPHIRGYMSPIVELRRLLELFANVRPFFSLPIVESREGIDAILVRENTEDLYMGRERKIRGGAIAERVITTKASRRIVDFAFRLAAREKRKKVTVIHKANVLRLTDGLFLKEAEGVAREYPDIVMESMLVDACAMKLVKKPQEFDVLVTTNMFGDILSDEAAALVGGLGVAASANIGNKTALFEPVHGSAPKYKGKNSANPVACFFAASMMLEFLGEKKTADSLRRAIMKSLQDGVTTRDLGGTLSMREVTEEVIKRYR